MSSNRALAPHMVGRQAQLYQLESLLQEASRGAGQIVFLAGDAGVGKTRLVREFLRRARVRDGVEILEGHCYDEDPAVPYGPFVNAIRSFMHTVGVDAITHVAGPWKRDLAMLLPELGTPAAAESAEPQLLKQRLFAALHHLLRPQSDQHCRIVVLEDLHWSDQTSQELLHYLSRSISRDRLLFLGTYRTDELHRRHPLTHLLAQLLREPVYHEVRLAPLSRAELADMLETTLERALPGGFVEALYSRTEGNPFFVEEVLKSLMAHAALDSLIQSVQQGHGIDQLAIPFSLKDSILRRTGDLDPTMGAVLTYAAVIGRRFDFEILLQLTGLTEADLLRALALLVERQLVVEEPGGAEDRYRFRHALTREAIYDDLLGRERRIKHREVLRVLEAVYQADHERIVDQLAYHSLQARETAQAARYARLAAERAARMYAYREAVAHYEVALELLDTDDPRAYADLYEQLGEVANPIGDSDRYLRYWREAQRYYEQVGDAIKVADIHRRLGRVLWDRGDSAGAFTHAKTALEILETAPPGYELAMAYSTLSQLHMLAFQQEESIAWGEKALQLAEQLGDVRVQAHALNNIGTSLAEIGEAERGIACLERSMALARQSNLTADVLRAYNNLGDRLAHNGEFKRSAALIREGIAFGAQVGWESFTSQLRSILAWIEMYLGHWEQARILIDAEMNERPVSCPWILITKAELLFYQGEIGAARQVFETVLTVCETANEPHLLEHALMHLARVLLRSGDPAQAIATVDRCRQLIQQWPATVDSADVLYCAIDIYLGAGAVTSARSLLASLVKIDEQKPNPLTRTLCAEAQGLLALYEHRFAEAVGYFERAGTGWRAMELPFDAAVSRRRLAESLLQTGDPAHRERARQELTAARQRFAHLGAVLELASVDALLRQFDPEPSVVQPIDTRLDELTPREREVIALLARGYSNREIANELVISAKTAEVHVSNILGKLGFTSRAQAAAYAVEHGLR